jgi:23S rRNA pseudouridine1911/1915/1917 synthase
MYGDNMKHGSKKIVLKVDRPDQLLNFLFRKFPDRSRKSVKSLLAHKQVGIENKTVTQFDFPLAEGQEVVINTDKTTDDITEGLKIIYEDDHVIVIDKDAGLLSVSTDDEKERTAFRILNSHVKGSDPSAKVFVVHRLDRDTSGLMMYAKDAEVREKLQDDWEKCVRRSYVAVVEGNVQDENGKIISWLKENRNLMMYSSRTPGDGRKAVTEYRILERNSEFTMLRINLETGRKNQIRVHMKDIGHVIIGDKKYGSVINPLRRLGLHALSLSFIHPVTGKKMEFETGIPGEFKRLFKKI